MKSLLIDDQRNITADKVARTFEEGIAALKEQHWDILYLDHDFGQEEHVDGGPYTRNGYGIMCFLEENPEYLPGHIHIVTSNPVGRQRIQVVIDRLYGEK